MRRARLGGWGEAPAGELTFTGGVGWAGCLSIRRFFCVSEARLVVSNFGHFPPLRKYLLTPELFSPLLNFFFAHTILYDRARVSRSYLGNPRSSRHKLSGLK